MTIRKYQKSMDFLIWKLPFQLVVQEIAQDINPNFRFTADTIFALQESSEVFLVNLWKTEIFALFTGGELLSHQGTSI